MREVLSKGWSGLDKRELFIQKCFNAWLTKDVAVFQEMFADDAIYIESWGPAYRNKKHIVAWFIDWTRSNKVLQWNINRFYHTDSTSICEWYFQCDCNGTVAAFDGVSIITFDETDKIRWLKEYQSKTPNVYPYE